MANHSQLAAIIRQIKNFGCRELLAAINRFAVVLESEPGRLKTIQWPGRIGGYPFPQQIVVATHLLAGLAKVVLAHGNQWASAAPTAKDVIFLQNQIQNLPSYFTTEPTGSVRPEELLFQLAYQQFPFQAKAEWKDLGRTVLLYRDVPRNLASEGFAAPMDLETAAEDIYGMNLSQFMWSGFFIYGHSLNKQSPYMRLGGSIDYVARIKDRWEGDPADMPTPETFKRFVELVSKTPRGFRGAIGDLRTKDDRAINVDYMPLLAYPIAQTGGDEIVVPVPKLLIDRITNGVFHDFANHFRGRGVENQFRPYFGKLVERYVGMQLALVFPEESLYPERDYGSQGRKTPDWLVNDGDKAVAIECRSSTFSLTTRINPRLEEMGKDLWRVGVETIEMAGPKLEDLKTGKTHIELRSGAQICLCLCTWEDLGPLGLFGALLRQQLSQAPGSSAPEFHLVPLPYLEMMCTVRDRKLFHRALGALMVQANWGDPHDEGPEKRWRDLMPQEIPRNPFIDEATRTFFSAFPVGKES